MIGFVGLGAMGARMARRLLDAGNELRVWNRDPSKAVPLVRAGAGQAASPAQAARGAEAVFVMVSDPAALEAVTEGPDGVAAGLGEGTTVVQMSTVSPAATDRLAAIVPGLLDAPVLGSISEAEDGSLTVFAGGARELVERWTPLLSALGTVLPVGPVGAGTAAKLVANTTLVGVTGVLGEALALASRLGLSTETAFEVLAATPLSSQAERRRAAFHSGDYPARFPVRLAHKDADLIAQVAPELRITTAARDWLAEAEAHGRADADYSSLLAEIHARLTDD